MRNRPFARSRVSAAIAGLIAMGLTGGCAGSTTATLVPPTDESDAIAADSCDPVESFEDVGNEHVADGTEVDDYNSEPPTSGPHYAAPADPGLYSSALPDEQLVHNLEHGQIVIYFSPAIPEEMIVELQELVASDPVGLLAVPYEAAASPSEIVLTAWTHLQRCDGISVKDIDSFRSEFQGRGPENVGVPAFDSGATA